MSLRRLHLKAKKTHDDDTALVKHLRPKVLNVFLPVFVLGRFHAEYQ